MEEEKKIITKGLNNSIKKFIADYNRCFFLPNKIINKFPSLSSIIIKGEFVNDNLDKYILNIDFSNETEIDDYKLNQIINKNYDNLKNVVDEQHKINIEYIEDERKIIISGNPHNIIYVLDSIKNDFFII